MNAINEDYFNRMLEVIKAGKYIPYDQEQFLGEQVIEQEFLATMESRRRAGMNTWGPDRQITIFSTHPEDKQ